MRKRRPSLVAGAGVVVVLALAISLFVGSSLGPAQPPPTARPTAAGSTPLTRAPLSVAAGDSVLIFGDSYTSGYGATPSTEGYAYKMAGLTGWDVTIDGVGGTGYLNAGNGKGTFQQRLDAAGYGDEFRMVILEGGSNDQGIEGDGFSDAVNEVITTMQQRFPRAQLVIVGPAAIVANANADKTRIDDMLRQISHERSLNYISPLREMWFPAGKDSPYVNWDVGHPNNEGYMLYARRLRDDIAALFAPSGASTAPNDSSGR